MAIDACLGFSGGHGYDYSGGLNNRRKALENYHAAVCPDDRRFADPQSRVCHGTEHKHNRAERATRQELRTSPVKSQATSAGARTRTVMHAQKAAAVYLDRAMALLMSRQTAVIYQAMCNGRPS